MSLAMRPLVLLSNDDGHASAGLRAMRDALAQVADVVVAGARDRAERVQPLAEPAQAAAAARRRARHLRARRHAGRLRLRRAARRHARAPAAPRPRRRGHQPRDEPRAGRVLLGHGRRRARGGPARHPRRRDERARRRATCRDGEAVRGHRPSPARGARGAGRGGRGGRQGRPAQRQRPQALERRGPRDAPRRAHLRRGRRLPPRSAGPRVPVAGRPRRAPRARRRGRTPTPTTTAPRRSRRSCSI